MQENNTKLVGKLKSFLFEDEIDAFNTLSRQIEKLKLEQHSIDDILVQIKPLLDQFLKERLADKDAETIDIYARHLSHIITKSLDVDKDAFSRALQPVISPAISKEIDENKDKMVDALYPIMGSMISKYVASAIQEMMEKINDKVEEGLSFGSYKRKLKSKISGVSESELLLEEGNDAQINSLFIISKASSLLIAESHIENQKISEPHMVASMASAIKDFINDWIAEHQEESEVQLLSYGKETLYIESAGSVYLIAFLDAEPSHEERRNIQEFFANIVKNYSTFFQLFDGDDSAKEIEEIETNMQSYLKSQLPYVEDTSHDNKSFAKYALIISMFIVMMYSAFLMKQKYEIMQLETLIMDSTSEEVSLEFLDDNHINITGKLHDIKHYETIVTLLGNEGYEIENNMNISVELFLRNMQKQEQILKMLDNQNIAVKKHLND